MSYGDIYNQDDLSMELNKICTYLWEGEAWHSKAANECRKMAFRGWGRWNDVEAMCDAKSRMCLEKLMRDRLEFAPDIDMSIVDRANKYTMTMATDLKSLHRTWLEREGRLVACLNKAISMAAMVDMSLYKELCRLVDEVQNEAMRVRIVGSRLDLSGWNGHDIGVCSKWLHDYFDTYDGGTIDFNLG